MQSFVSELRRRNVLRVAAFYAAAGWLLVQVATQVFPFFDIPNWVVRVVVVAIALGFPAALALAWFYELTPQGLKLESRIAPAESITRQTGRRLDRWIIAVLGLAVVLLLVDKLVLHRGAPPALARAEQSIAVLPLVNNSGDPANEYFSDGLTEEMISILAKVPDLKLIGRASAFHFKNSTEDSKSIGEKLGVAKLLEGSVSRQGERVRIVAELIDAADGRELWSETYDRELKDVFAAQTEIATAVAEQMKLKLLGGATGSDAAPSNESQAAHNAVLQGDFHFQQFTEQGMHQAIAAYQEAIRLDPQYALAYARLSLASRQLSATWLVGDEAAQANGAALQAAQTALAMAPQLARAHEALGWVRLTAEFDLAAAEAEMRHASELAPGDAAIISALAYLHAAQGRLPEAEALARRALEVDPLALGPYLNLARILIAQRRDDEAGVFIRKGLELQPQAARAHAYLVQIDALHGDAKSALEHAAQEPEGFWHDYAAALAQQVQPDRAAADAALQQFIAKRSEGGPFQIAVIYGLRQDVDHTFEWLDRAYTLRDSGLTQLMVNPTLLAYRKDPRFAALCARLKITLPPEPAA